MQVEYNGIKFEISDKLLEGFGRVNHGDAAEDRGPLPADLQKERPGISVEEFLKLPGVKDYLASNPPKNTDEDYSLRQKQGATTMRVEHNGINDGFDMTLTKPPLKPGNTSKPCIVIGWPTIAQLARGLNVILNDAILIPDSQLFNTSRKVENAAFSPCECSQPREVICSGHRCGTCHQMINPSGVKEHPVSAIEDSPQKTTNREDKLKEAEKALKEAEQALNKALEGIGIECFPFSPEDPTLPRPSKPLWPELKPNTHGMAREIDTGIEPDKDEISKMAAKFVVSLLGIKPENTDKK